MKCNNCGREVASNTYECPHCGARLKDKSKIGCLSGIGLILILWWLGFYYGKPYLSNESATDHTVNSETSWKDQDNATTAYSMIKEHVIKTLNAPGSVTFPVGDDGYSDHIQYMGNHNYLITSYVDYQDTNDNNVRVRFIAEIQQTSETDWALVSLDFP